MEDLLRDGHSAFPISLLQEAEGCRVGKEEERAVQRERAPESLQTVPFDSSVDL